MTDVEARPKDVPADPASTAPGSHSLRLHRLVVLVTAVTALVAGVFITPAVRAAVRTADRPALWAMLLFLLLPPLVAGCAAAIGMAGPPRRSGPDDARGTAPPPCARSAVFGTADRVWRTSLLVLVVGYAILVLLASWFPLLPPVESSDVAPLPNPLTNYVLTIAVAATAVLPDRVRFAYVTALAIPLAGTYPADAGHPSHIPVEEVLIYLASNLGNMGVLTWLLHQADILDEADARRRDLVIRLRTDESRSRAQRAGDDFIHDHILSVLKSVATAPTGSPRLRRSARQALASLSGPPGPQRAPACPASELLGILARRLQAIGDGGVVTSGSIEQDLLMPRDVARAVVDAAAEAVRNSLTHAAPPSRRAGTVTRTATLRSDWDGITVTVSDDGRGFDPRRATLDRHGVTGSIVTRMRDAGGSARVDSTPGTGTVVTLIWRQEASSPDSPGPSATSAHGPTRPFHRNGAANRTVSPLFLASCMEAPSTRVVATFILAAYVVVAVLEILAGESYRLAQPVVGSLLGLSVAAYLMLRSWPDHRMPGWAAALVAILLGATNLIVMFQIDFAGWPGYASWCTGAGTALCCGLLARERPRQAWAGLGLLTATSSAWILTTGRSPLMILTYMSGQVIPLCIWHAIARLSVAMSAATARAEALSAEATSQRRAEQESEAVMREIMNSVRERVEPLLRTLSSGRPVTADLCTAARMLEAELRDDRQARFFTGTAVVRAARRARARGLEVILLDDRGGAEEMPEHVRHRVISRAVHALDGAAEGRVVIRLLPHRQRPNLMSIVAQEDTCLLGPDGEPISPS